MAFGFGGLSPYPTLNAFDLEDVPFDRAKRIVGRVDPAPAQAGIVAMPPSAPTAPQPEAPAATPAPPSLVGAVPPAFDVGAAAPPARAPAPPRPAPAPKADMPAPGAVPAMAPAPVASAPAPAPAPAPHAADDGFMAGLRRFRDNGGFDYLGALGAGLLSAPTMAGGVAAGLQLAQRGESQRAAGDLARTELALKKTKLAQEQATLTGNARLVKSKLPGLSDDQALAFGGNASFMTELMKNALPPQELYQQYVDGDGNRWNRNTRTGQESVALQAREDKTFRTLTDPTERARYGIEATDKRVAQIGADGHLTFPGAGGQNITISGPEKEQDKTLGKGYGEYQIDLATKGRNAGSTLNTLALMEQAMKSPGFYSGVGGEGVKRANQFLGALGVKDSKAASAAEVFDALSNKVVLDGLGGSLGPGISNTDRDYISRTAPTLAQSEQGNRDLIGVARALAQRQQAVSKFARDYAVKNGGRLDAGFDQALDEFAEKNQLFPQARQGASASAPQEPPQGSPNGARRAPDGNWYVADPNRPGKFMRVQ